jgi:hypothetical protein
MQLRGESLSQFRMQTGANYDNFLETGSVKFFVCRRWGNASMVAAGFSMKMAAPAIRL